MSKIKEKRTILGPKTLDIALAIKQCIEGSPELYYKLMKQLSQDVPVDILKVYLKEFAECVTLLDQRFHDFVRVILNLNWYTSESLCKKYFDFVVSLSIAHPVHLIKVLTALVQRFKPSIDPLQATIIQKKQHLAICSHVQAALNAIQKRVPMMQNTLMNIIVKEFPYFKNDIFQVECYVRNLLQLTLFMPTYRLKILELIISKVTVFDVSCPRHIIIEAEKEDEASDFVFEMEVEKTNEDPKPLLKLPEAEVLDILMSLLLTYVTNTIYQNFDNTDATDLKLDWSSCKRLFRELLLVFETIILPTHATCHVQFIFFYICKYNVQLCDGFLDFLWKKFYNPNTNIVFRQACASYLGSFLARSRYLPTSSMIMCLDEFCNWIHYYIDLVIIPKDKKPNLFTSHGSFYYLCQAVFYVFVFRHREIFESAKGFNRVSTWNFQHIVTCHLNPLKFCAPHLIEKFASITRLYQIAMCDTIIERNRREVFDHEFLEVFTADKKNNLDFFFPFDPCVLPRTNKFLKPLFREYDSAESNGDVAAVQVMNDDEVDFLPPESCDPMQSILNEDELSCHKVTNSMAHVSSKSERTSQPLFSERNELIEEMMASL